MFSGSILLPPAAILQIDYHYRTYARGLNLNIRVNSFAALKEMLRNDYGGRLADVLVVRE